MAFILSLETSTTVTSVAIHEDGKLVATEETHIPQSAASKLAVMIKEVGKTSGVDLKQVNAIAVSSGPGSYTGLRIGTSTAKGLCYALNVPLIAVGSLDLMAHHVSQKSIGDLLLCPMIDARRMEVYCEVTDHKLEKILPVEAKIIDDYSFADLLRERKMIFFGDGAAKCAAVIKSDNAIFLPDVFPLATDLGYLAFRKFAGNQVEDLMRFEPFYLKDFVAKKATSKL